MDLTKFIALAHLSVLRSMVQIVQLLINVCSSILNTKFFLGISYSILKTVFDNTTHKYAGMLLP